MGTTFTAFAGVTTAFAWSDSWLKKKRRMFLKPIKNFPTHELIASGHRACQGCAEVLAVRHVLKAIGPDMVLAMATGCMEIISSPYPFTSWAVPWIHVAFENAAAVGSGVEAAFKVLKRKGPTGPTRK